MNWKKIIMLALGLLALSTAIFIINRRERRNAGVEGILLDFPAAEIKRIELRQKDMKFVFARIGALWYLQEPLAAKADQDALESILDDFCPLSYDRLVEENARALKHYGLVQPEIELKLFSAGKAAPAHSILLGMKNNLDSSSYAKLAGNGKVVLIAAYKRSDLEKNLFAFRDKKILGFDSLAVTALEYRDKNKVFRFSKKGYQWFMEKPLSAPALEYKINDLLANASLLEAKSFAGHDRQASRRVLGLETPLLSAVFTLTDGEKKITVFKNDERCYALVDGSNEICEIDNGFYEKFSFDSSALRENKIAPFYAFAVRELQFQSDSCRFTIKKNNNSGWELLEPQPKIKLSEDKISRLLTALADCEAREFVDNPKGAPEFFTTIKVQAENPQNPRRLMTVEMDFAGPGAYTVIVRNPALPYWFKVDKGILGKLPAKIADISEVTAEKDSAKK